VLRRWSDDPLLGIGLMSQRIVHKRVIAPYGREIVSRGQRIVHKRVIDPYAKEIHKRPGAA
jgi:hypothetical protein